MKSRDDLPPTPEWECCPHRECPCMETPAPEPREEHLVRGDN